MASNAQFNISVIYFLVTAQKEVDGSKVAMS